MTIKQKLFCQYYIINWNATEAAIKAGYSEKTASVIANQNLGKLYIKNYIEEIQKDIAKLAGISQLKVLNEHKKIAFSSIAHLHNTWIRKKEFEELTEDQKDCILEIQTKVEKSRDENDKVTGIIEFVKVKLYDKQKSLDSISKMLGYDSAQKIDHSSTDGTMGRTGLEHLSFEQLLEIENAKRKGTIK